MEIARLTPSLSAGAARLPLAPAAAGAPPLERLSLGASSTVDPSAAMRAAASRVAPSSSEPSVLGRIGRCALFGALSATAGAVLGPVGIPIAMLGGGIVEGLAYCRESPFKGFMSGIVHGGLGAVFGAAGGLEGVLTYAATGAVGGAVTSHKLDELPGAIAGGIKRLLRAAAPAPSPDPKPAG